VSKQSIYAFAKEQKAGDVIDAGFFKNARRFVRR
jgi:hypothetical protein